MFDDIFSNCSSFILHFQLCYMITMLIFLPLIGQEIFSNMHEMLCKFKQKHVVMEYKQIQLPYIND